MVVGGEVEHRADVVRAQVERLLVVREALLDLAEETRKGVPEVREDNVELVPANVDDLLADFHTTCKFREVVLTDLTVRKQSRHSLSLSELCVRIVALMIFSISFTSLIPFHLRLSSFFHILY